MSQFIFCPGNGRVSAAKTRKIERVAKEHGADFITANISGDGPRFWFVGPNYGQPFDQRLRDRVLDALEEEGLLPIEGTR